MERDGTSYHYPMIYISLLTTQNIPLRIKDFTETQDSCVFYTCESYGIQMLEILYIRSLYYSTLII